MPLADSVNDDVNAWRRATTILVRSSSFQPLMALLYAVKEIYYKVKIYASPYQEIFAIFIDLLADYWYYHL